MAEKKLAPKGKLKLKKKGPAQAKSAAPATSEPSASQKLKAQKIKDYKELLRDKAYQIYKSKISDDTKFGERKWRDIKVKVLKSDSYLKKSWYKKLTEFEKGTIEELKNVQ